MYYVCYILQRYILQHILRSRLPTNSTTVLFPLYSWGRRNEGYKRVAETCSCLLNGKVMLRLKILNFYLIMFSNFRRAYY